VLHIYMWGDWMFNSKKGNLVEIHNIFWVEAQGYASRMNWAW
jgi:hypothetical protein